MHMKRQTITLQSAVLAELARTIIENDGRLTMTEWPRRSDHKCASRGMCPLCPQKKWAFPVRMLLRDHRAIPVL